MSRRKVTLLSYEDVGGMGFEEFVAFVNGLRAQIPDSCMDSVSFDLESEYDSSYVNMSLSYERPATPEERAADAEAAARKRQQAEASRKATAERQEARERELYAALKAKYEGHSN